MSRSLNGVNIGGGAGSAGTLTPDWLAALPANQESTRRTNSGSRRARLVWVMRSERVSIEKANCSGSSLPK